MGNGNDRQCLWASKASEAIATCGGHPAHKDLSKATAYPPTAALFLKQAQNDPS